MVEGNKCPGSANSSGAMDQYLDIVFGLRDDLPDFFRKSKDRVGSFGGSMIWPSNELEMRKGVLVNVF